MDYSGETNDTSVNMFENKSIEDLLNYGLSSRAARCLQRAGIKDTNMLFAYLVKHNGSLEKIRYFGKHSLLEIHNAAPEVFQFYNEFYMNESNSKQRDYIIEDLCFCFIRRDELKIQLESIEQNIRELTKKLIFENGGNNV